ncbi:hypothetical protein ACOTTU_21795 [Roseobacter sp. EG26]|uniref:hypothetical protein n=1 Tax=Roseobacter sp. EG26 TaxID=3412477 RepID=UPI003CE586C8
MVLDLFDYHRNTFCRNEPNELVGTAFTGLGDNMFPEPRAGDFDARWRQAIAHTIRANGARDRFGTEKDYFRAPWRAHLGQSLMSRQKFRARVLPRPQGQLVEEWPCPALYYDAAAQARALPVLKILLSPAWVLKAHDLIDTQLVVHVIRRPQGFAQSWWSRYVTGIGGGPEKVFADNQPSLIRILQHFGREEEMPSHYSLADLVVSELWRWRYMNEVLLDQMSGSDRYLTLAYEDVMHNKLPWAEKLYGFAGLEMTPACRQSISSMQNTLFKARKSDGLDPKMVEEAVAQVIGDSPFRDKLLNVDPGAVS